MRSKVVAGASYEYSNRMVHQLSKDTCLYQRTLAHLQAAEAEHQSFDLSECGLSQWFRVPCLTKPVENPSCRYLKHKSKGWVSKADCKAQHFTRNPRETLRLGTYSLHYEAH